MDKTLVSWNEHYLPKILKFQNYSVDFIGTLPVVDDSAFSDHNNLIRLNSMFSNHPRFMPVDRSFATKHPFKYWIPRSWSQPVEQWTIDVALEHRVKSLVQSNKKLNLMWSGGIDSTAMLAAFLQHCPDRRQLRIMYSPWSTYEHPGYLEFLKKFNDLELIDISGTVYMNWGFDGLVISGEGGDELTASIDESFIKEHGTSILHTPWEDFFFKKYPDTNFIDFCKVYFNKAQRPIETVLEARWWFYAICKNRSILNSEKLPLLFDNNATPIENYVGFFDCDEFENYIYWNIEDCITGSEYSSWKQTLKDYAYRFDGFDEWRKTKRKHGSSQIIAYSEKKTYLKQQHWLALFSDGSVATTPSLPVLTRLEYQRYNHLDWIFND